jgi:sporulation protein YlmC with PRC-barrel domain
MPTATGHTKAIRASRVIGTKIYAQSGEGIGQVEDVVLDKTSKRIMFAVVSVGGVVTTSDSYFPVPWSMLDYNEEKEGYVMPCSKEELASGPNYSKLSEVTKDDAVGVRDQIRSHYNVMMD